MRRRSRLTWILCTIVAAAVVLAIVLGRTRIESRQEVLGRLGTPIAVAGSAVESSSRGNSLLSSPEITFTGLARYSSDHDVWKTWIYDMDDSELEACLQEWLEGKFSDLRGTSSFVLGSRKHLLLVDVDAEGNCRLRKAKAVFFHFSR